MMKKIALIVFLLCFIISCGKKGDPKYEGSLENVIKDTINKNV